MMVQHLQSLIDSSFICIRKNTRCAIFTICRGVAADASQKINPRSTQVLPTTGVRHALFQRYFSVFLFPRIILGWKEPEINAVGYRWQRKCKASGRMLSLIADASIKYRIKEKDLRHCPARLLEGRTVHRVSSVKQKPNLLRIMNHSEFEYRLDIEWIEKLLQELTSDINRRVAIDQKPKPLVGSRWILVVQYFWNAIPDVSFC
jgi:hypothetical protein